MKKWIPDSLNRNQYPQTAKEIFGSDQAPFERKQVNYRWRYSMFLSTAAFQSNPTGYLTPYAPPLLDLHSASPHPPSPSTAPLLHSLLVS
ncbi:unnamed protein product [Tuber melanosporum]|uniref:(Perigord truffle) hypothetical protein n=1 Tax=Tuber melanosporum (strain Mel28) TaxID=656061 RepID=D5GIZ5_TUBMM|nr:uncharacterized protein GSTUM_00008751001 [Tuber melanosporum]CAZ84488.1 unnamed protein product [Tuber melanosporum]